MKRYWAGRSYSWIPVNGRIIFGVFNYPSPSLIRRMGFFHELLLEAE